MLDPQTLTDAVVTSLQGIPELVTMMGNDPSRIYAYHYLYGADYRFQQALYKMNPPNILVAWDGTLSGNFDGYTIWKHKVSCFMRTSNVVTADIPSTYEHMFYVMMNGSVNGGQNIRYIHPIPQVDICDTPQAVHMVDEEGMDYFKIEFIWPELGDS